MSLTSDQEKDKADSEYQKYDKNLKQATQKFEKDIFSFAVLCLYKPSADKLQIKESR